MRDRFWRLAVSPQSALKHPPQAEGPPVQPFNSEPADLSHDAAALLPSDRVSLLWFVRRWWPLWPFPDDSDGQPAPGAANFFLPIPGISGTLSLHKFDAGVLLPRPCDFLMIQDNNNIHSISTTPPITMGKYRIAACPRPLDCGRFAAQVSIASGSGRGTTDRVMRFHDLFPTRDAAAHYAMAQGIEQQCGQLYRPRQTSLTVRRMNVELPPHEPV